MINGLFCTGVTYDIRTEMLDVTTWGDSRRKYIGGLNTVDITAKFTTSGSENTAEIMQTFQDMLTGKTVDFVQHADKPRCFYCGSLNEPGKNHCTQCGVPL